MSKERDLLERVLTSELWSVQAELQAEIKELLAESEQQPVATKLETHQFNAFHVSADDFKKLQKLPVGTKLYTAPPKREPSMTGREMYQRGYAAAERDLKREPLSDEEINAINLPEKQCTLRELVRLIEKAHGIGIDDEHDDA